MSSLGSVSDSSLRRRRVAMAKAVEGAPNAGELILDFYDRTRIATWVRSHRGLILWVKKQIGKPVQGWQSYGAWGIHRKGAMPNSYWMRSSASMKGAVQDPAPDPARNQPPRCY